MVKLLDCTNKVGKSLLLVFFINAVPHVVIVNEVFEVVEYLSILRWLANHSVFTLPSLLSRGTIGKFKEVFNFGLDNWPIE